MSKTLEILREDLFRFKKEKNKDLSSIVEILLATIQNHEITLERELNEEDVISVLRSESKKMTEPMELFEKAGRKDLLNQSIAQKEYIDGLLPMLMSEDQVGEYVDALIKQMGELTMRDFGKVMGQAMRELKGKADGNTVKAAIERALSE